MVDIETVQTEEDFLTKVHDYDDDDDEEDGHDCVDDDEEEHEGEDV